MDVNVKKTKVMVFSKIENVQCNIKVNGEYLEQVTSYRYLGVTEHGRSEVEIKTRIAMAKKAFWKMKEVTRGQVNLTARKRILNCYVFSVLKYGCESWTWTKVYKKG